VLFTNGPLELEVEARVTAEGVAIRVSPPQGGAARWTDIWFEAEDLTRWLQGIDDARKRQKLERQSIAHLLALQRQLAGLPRPPGGAGP